MEVPHYYASHDKNLNKAVYASPKIALYTNSCLLIFEDDQANMCFTRIIS